MSGLTYLLVLSLFLITLPLQALVAIAVVVTSGFPVFFRQKRVGKDGAVFWLYKFRTMVIGAEAKQKTLSYRNESSGPTFKIGKDPRFTLIGRFLSHTGLDELPQFVNVLRGDMVLIGPRPLPVAEAKRLRPWMRKRERMKPGIISPAILTGTYHDDFDAWMRRDIAYVNSKHSMGDCVLLIRSVGFLFRLLGIELVTAVQDVVRLCTRSLSCL